MTCGLATALKPPHFNHAPVRGAIGAIQYVAGYVTKFQSTHPRGVRRDGQPPDCRCGDVSIHAPAWGATEIPEGVRIQAECFNPRTRVGCDERKRESSPADEMFQSTHPRGVRPVHGSGRLDDGSVSIHAPAWGATGHVFFTHVFTLRFNPRTRVGCDAQDFGLIFYQGPVSIHAPAWGATPRWPPDRRQKRVSIHAPAWGATLLRSITFKVDACFNPRTRVGCDISFSIQVRPRAGVSIHAPAWGATPRVLPMMGGQEFQSTHPRGVRPVRASPCAWCM